MNGLYEFGSELSRGLIKHTVFDPSSKAGQREMADFVAARFAQVQQEFVLHGIRVTHLQHLRQNPNAPVSTYTNYGRSNMDSGNLKALKTGGKSRFFIALGSNVGDRLDMIEKACLEMEKEGIQIVRTSGLWETKAMYVEDQANFLNGVCEVSPYTLFRALVHKR